MCCAGFPWVFGLPSTAAAQGNQPMISELRAVTLVPGLEPNARNAFHLRQEVQVLILQVQIQLFILIPGGIPPLKNGEKRK